MAVRRWGVAGESESTSWGEESDSHFLRKRSEFKIDAALNNSKPALNRLYRLNPILRQQEADPATNRGYYTQQLQYLQAVSSFLSSRLPTVPAELLHTTVRRYSILFALQNFTKKLSLFFIKRFSQPILIQACYSVT